MSDHLKRSADAMFWHRWQTVTKETITLLRRYRSHHITFVCDKYKRMEAERQEKLRKMAADCWRSQTAEKQKG